jgi:hypothetical protein
MRLAIISIAWSWPMTRWPACRQLEHGLDLVARHAADRDAGPVGHHAGHGLVVDGGQDQRRLALQRGQLGLHLAAGQVGGAESRLGAAAAAGIAAGLARAAGFQRAAGAFHRLEPLRAAWRAGPAVRRPGLFLLPARVQRGQARTLAWPAARWLGLALAVSMPMAFSRPMMPSSVSSASMRLRQSSTSAGVACRLTATRAQAVSSRLTALSGSWRAGM